MSESTIRQLSQRRGLRQFAKFAVVGASGFVVNLVVFTLLQRLVPNHAEPAPYMVIYSIAFLAGGVSNYFFNRVWTFRSTGHVATEGLSFLTVSVLALIVGLIVAALIAPAPIPFVGRAFGHGHLTWFISTVAGIFVNFFVNKYWTFRSAD